MNDSARKTTSCLTVAEKRTHRPGGCVGIFFQLFDWNRRFAKKKLFSRKLLPPARAKQAANKFKGDEKMPTSKFHLIAADENSGGFPHNKHSNRNMDLERKHEMRAPGLVARLMGLESIPAVRGTTKEGCLHDACDNGERKYTSNFSRSEREAVNMERGSTKFDSRPQKLQKTGQFERKAVPKFGADAIQIKNVLSRSRKHNHHPKLASPLRSPRISSSKVVSRTSRLIDAATKILEPGLQSASKTKSALTYSSSICDAPPSYEVKADGIMVDEKPSKQSAYCSNAVDLAGKTSCQNCGNVLDMNFIPNTEERPPVFQPFTSKFVDGSYLEGTRRSKARIPMPSHEQETVRVSLRSSGQHISSAVQRKEEMNNSTQSNFKPIAERNSLLSECHDPRKPPYNPSRPCNDESSSITLKHKSQVLDQMLLIRKDRIPHVSTVNNFQNRRVSSTANVGKETKDFVALNRSLSSRNQPRTSKMEISRIAQERKAINGRHESLPHLRSSARKRRTVNISGQVESREGSSSQLTKQRNVHSNALAEKGFRLNSQSLNHASARSRFVGQKNGDGASKSNGSDVISFTFNSPMRDKTQGPMGMDKKITDNELNKSFQTPSLDSDSIGSLLEQKLKELTCQEDDKLTTDGAPKRSTATILQELISALIAERPDIAFPSVVENSNVNLTKSSLKDHLSPGSVLEASFSSSSLDDSSGHRMYLSLMEYSDDQLQLSEPDGDLSDSATSMIKVGTSSEVIVLVSNISKILHSITFAMGRLTDSMIANTKDVILNAELLFGSMALQNTYVKDLVVSPIFLELETIANAIWANINTIKGLEATKAENHFMEFIFDSMVECLDLRYGQYCNLGFNAWRRLPLCMTREMMIGVIAEDINKWTYLAGMATDEIIEWEMGHSRGKWTDFDVETFETGLEIDGDILQVLVHEIVLDLLECRSKQSCF